MATAAPRYMQGARRTFGPPSLVTAPIGAGTAALTDDAQLRQLMALLQQFYIAQAMQGLPAGQAPEDMIGGADDFSQQGPGIDISPGQGGISPETLALLGTIFGAGGQLVGNEGLGALGSVMGLGGNLPQTSPEGALVNLGGVAANLAGANPAVTGGVTSVLGMMMDPVPPTAGDIAGKAANLAFNLTPLGPINSIMNLLTGKNVGTMVKGAMTPVTEIDTTEAIVQQANQQAAAQDKDPMDVLMSLTNAFGTAPPPPVVASPSAMNEIPGVQMLEVAKSMLDMPEPVASMSDIGLDLSSISSGIAGLGMDIAPAGDVSPGAGSSVSDGAPSSPDGSVEGGGW